MITIHGRYRPPAVKGLVTTQASMTQQQFKQETDVNFLLERYAKTGSWTGSLMSPTRQPQFGDFTNVLSFADAQQAVIDAQNMFLQLPAQLRKRFQNNPAELIAFLENPANKEEATKLGFFNPPEPTPIPNNEPPATT